MLEVTGLTKTFRAPKRSKKDVPSSDPREDGKWFHAVQDVSFHCKEGEILGLLGMNGAGKTTTLRMLSTAIKPSKGTAVMNGVDIVKDPLEVKKHVGFLSGATGLYGRLTAKEMVAYFGQLNRMAPDLMKSRMESLFDLLDMRDFLNRRCDNLSTGMKQRVNIARTVIHDPQVLFFDEPTAGLDVLSMDTIVNFVKKSREQGKTVVLSTHYMDEVERLCDRLVVIHHGRVFFTGTVDEMKAKAEDGLIETAFKNMVKGE
jgi:sodium transport system ATP-binding protein